MKCYTIIDSFDGGNELWVANYEKKEDAIKCLEKILEHYKSIDENGKVNEEGWNPTVNELFEYLLCNGCSYTYYYGSDVGSLFVRDQEMNETFDDNNLPF